MAKEALKLWMDIPADIRGKILSNVWCPDCRTAVTICDYSVDFDGGVVVLRGFCGTCGHKVARVLKGVPGVQKRRPNARLNTIFLMCGFWEPAAQEILRIKFCEKFRLPEKKPLRFR